MAIRLPPCSANGIQRNSAVVRLSWSLSHTRSRLSVEILSHGIDSISPKLTQVLIHASVLPLGALLLAFSFATMAFATPDAAPFGGRKVLILMGAKMENSGTPEQLAAYEADYAKLDLNQDGFVNAAEFAKHGNELTRQAGHLVLDREVGGLVFKDEFLLDRVINAEAKEFFQRIDNDGNAQIHQHEFLAGSSLADPELAGRVFNGFDANGDLTLSVTEFLSVWSRWAREAPIEARLIAIEQTYTLPKEWQSDAFRKRIIEEEQSENLPASPKVKLVLELHNTSDEPIMISPGGGIDEPELTVQGPGLVAPDRLRSFSGTSSGSTPQPVIRPGKRFRIAIGSLNPGEFSLDNVYWTQAGEYTITASYPVWMNLAPHLPQLFKNQPVPKGLPIKFIVTSSACRVKVVAEP
ncbi:EF hand [Novipirellula galeiformis]|uniref:EF hand n=1 Tax=Novipirellula galeiformis TaxID=2528004 RepID=A0A5C6C1F4_9BACT|nr:EF hand [Novipirellula galeiformis]